MTEKAGPAPIGNVAVDHDGNTGLDTLEVEARGFTANAAGAAMTVRSTITYASGQIIAQSATAGSCSAIPVAVGRINGGTGMIRRCRLKSSDTSGFVGKAVRVHMFRDNPTFTNGDGGNFAGGLSESAYMGYFDVTLDMTFSDFVKGIAAPAIGAEMNFDCAGASQNVYLVFEARGAITSGSAKTLTPVLETLQN